MAGNGIPTRYSRRFIFVCLLSSVLPDYPTLAQQFTAPTNPTEKCLPSANAPSGHSTPSCEQQAIAELAHSGHAYAQNQMGIESALVLSSNRTIQDARRWFEMAAEQGYLPAQVNLAVLYLNGWGTPQNYGAALYWLQAAAEKGDPRAHTNLGILYLKGWGVRQDYAEALRNFHFAAELGETGAIVNLGFMADGGLGTVKDYSTAADWYRKAAERGDSLGQNNLADLYLRGEGVQQDDSEAFAWFQKAAAQGHTGARIKLGFLYMMGRGVPKDPESAYVWILAASLAGDQRGQKYLDQLENVLSLVQLAKVRERAEALSIVPEHRLIETAFVR